MSPNLKHLFQSNTIGGFCLLSFSKQNNIILLSSLVLHSYFLSFLSQNIALQPDSN